jgi:SAM-dependent methyltransferase
MSGIAISDDIAGYFSDVPKGAVYLEEAAFGLRRVWPRVAALPEGARVLEVGSGPCIALAEIAARRPDLRLEGVEPMGDGFAFFDDFIPRIRRHAPTLQVHIAGWSDAPVTGRYDLIFLVNVFEHLPDWRAFLGFVRDRLADDGVCVILCPNYGFPYESHFRLPVVGGKALTGALFRRRIERFERENDCKGLWRSLNFVRLSEVRRAALTAGLTLTARMDILAEMIARVDAEPEFAARQGALRLPALALARSGMLDRLIRFRAVQNVAPYMELELRREAAA